MAHYFFLPKGGFARVYEVADRAGVRQAIKVVTKDSLKTKKAKTKARGSFYYVIARR